MLLLLKKKKRWVGVGGKDLLMELVVPSIAVTSLVGRRESRIVRSSL